jgi:DNA repair protein RadC
MMVRDTEMLAVAFCNEGHLLMGITCYPGTRTQVDFPLNEILVEALTSQARGVVIAHNHPSGIALPSECDLASTRRLARVGAAVGVTLLDHLLFAGASQFSFRQQGLI